MNPNLFFAVPLTLCLLSCSKVTQSFRQAPTRSGMAMDCQLDTLVETFSSRKTGKPNFQVYKLDGNRLFVKDFDYLKNGEYVIYIKADHLKKAQGQTYWYYPDGKLKATTIMIDGKAEGTSQYYHKNGQLEGIVNFKKGKYHGTMLLYWENGQPYGELDYVEGRLKAVRGFQDKQGKPIPKGSFKNGNGDLWRYDETGEKVEKIEVYWEGKLTKTAKYGY